jgi:hypothetical protein
MGGGTAKAAALSIFGRSQSWIIIHHHMEVR